MGSGAVRLTSGASRIGTSRSRASATNWPFLSARMDNLLAALLKVSSAA